MTTKTQANKNKANGGRPMPEGAVKVLEKFTEKLPVKTDEETIRAAAAEMAHGIRLQEALDEERREAMSGFKERQAAIKDRQKALADTVEKGTVLEDVECIDYLTRQNEVITVRQDTGEVTETRMASAEELQETLLDGKKKDDADEAPAGA